MLQFSHDIKIAAASNYLATAVYYYASFLLRFAMSNTRSAALITVIPDMISMEVELSPVFGRIPNGTSTSSIAFTIGFSAFGTSLSDTSTDSFVWLRDVLWYWNHRRLRHHHCSHRLQWSLLHTSEGISHHIQ